MTVLEFMRGFSDMASDRKYNFEVRKNPGDGTSNRAYWGEMKDELPMKPTIKSAEIWKWLINEKKNTIVVVIREDGRNDYSE